MLLVTFRCPVTQETQQEVLCDKCANLLAPLPDDTKPADPDCECTNCRPDCKVCGRSGPVNPFGIALCLACGRTQPDPRHKGCKHEAVFTNDGYNTCCRICGENLS